jgi:hypothetical protein
VWDYIDERLFDKPNTSDCTQFADLTTIPAPGELRSRIKADTEAWFVLWTVYDCLVFVAAIIAGIIVFQVSASEVVELAGLTYLQKTPEQMYADA